MKTNFNIPQSAIKLGELNMFIPNSEKWLNSRQFASIKDVENTPTNQVDFSTIESNPEKAPKLYDHAINHFGHLNKNVSIDIIDIGGYIGLFGISFTKALSKLGFNKIDTTIFEPTPLYQIIDRNIQANHINDNCKVLNGAISNSDSVMPYYAIPENLISGRMFSFPNSQHLYDVKTQTLDNFYKKKDNDDKLIIVKIDTEGHELEVIAGAEEFFKNNNLVLYLEFWPWLEKKTKIFNKTYSEFLTENFHIIDIDNVGWPKFDSSRVIQQSEFSSFIEKVDTSSRRTTDLLCISKNINKSFVSNEILDLLKVS